jgi:hypothetical protein
MKLSTNAAASDVGAILADRAAASEHSVSPRQPWSIVSDARNTQTDVLALDVRAPGGHLQEKKFSDRLPVIYSNP